MAYEFLKNLFGNNEDGTPKALTAEELVAAIEANKDISVVDLKAGGYISQAKYDRIVTEKDGLQTQLTEASNKLKSFQSEDGKTIEDIRKEAADWKTKYDTDTKALQDKLSAQERSHLIDQYLSGFEFTSSLAKKSLKDLMAGAKELSVKDGALIGADDLMKGYKETYADAFKQAENPDAGAAGGNNNPGQPFFSKSTKNGSGAGGGNKLTEMSLAEKMQYANEHPGMDISTLFA